MSDIIVIVTKIQSLELGAQAIYQIFFSILGIKPLTFGSARR
jgi:hypothetical protein